MILERTMDATFLNYVANHPDVRPWLGKDPGGATDSHLDLQPFLDAGKGFALILPHYGAFLIETFGNGICELHTMFLPEKRGAPVFLAADAMLSYLFNETDCKVLFTQLPEGNRAAKAAALRVGFKIVPDRPSAWRLNGGVGEDAAITKELWLQRREHIAPPRIEAQQSELPCLLPEPQLAR